MHRLAVVPGDATVLFRACSHRGFCRRFAKPTHSRSGPGFARSTGPLSRLARQRVMGSGEKSVSVVGLPRHLAAKRTGAVLALLMDEGNTTAQPQGREFPK